ncbi:hypothetical protein TNIN_5591 [Trichonephila inaurata madagascariensis]|uniref:Uncharacterized protein n=1 Tax=Trichonephila inaurata madagascariensis TaxID=2747483 RepID=A0A8X7CJC3_9ARAC|nr:hypothetical protein TNIN_5591 [Trichonephila inaurata madagascariensis]
MIAECIYFDVRVWLGATVELVKSELRVFNHVVVYFYLIQQLHFGYENQFYLVCDKLVNYYECASEHNFTQVDLCSWPLILKRSETLVQDLCANQSVLRNNEIFDNLSEICIKDSYMKDCYMIAISRNCGYEESRAIGEILSRSESYYQSCRDRNEYTKAITAITYSNKARIKDIFLDYEDEYAGSRADSREFKATT